MTTRDPGNRYWRTPRGAVVVAVLAWLPVLAVCVHTGHLMGQPDAWGYSLTDDSLWNEPGLWITASWVSGMLVLFLLVLLVKNREGAWSVGYDVCRYLGTVATGIGVGGLVTLTGEHHGGVPAWAVPLTVVGVLLLCAPWPVTSYLDSRQRHREEVRWNGAGSPGVVTGLWSFVEDEVWIRHRATVRFTDTSGTQRWFRRLAPRGTHVQEGDAVMVHFDPAHPGRRRSISVDWHNAAADRATGRGRRPRGPGRLP